MIKNAQTFAVAVLAAASFAACGAPEGKEAKAGDPAALPADVVAKIGNETISTAELKRRMEDKGPFIRARFDTIERKREMLDDEIRFEILAQEAARRGLDKDPDVLNAMKKTMVQKLLRDQTEGGDGVTVSEEEVRAFYDENINDYVKPERVRVSHVFFAAEKGDANRGKMKAEATKALATARAKPNDRAVFSDLAKTLSNDEASKRAGGDLSFKTREDLAAAWGEAFANAAFGLKEINDIASSVVETDKGFHVVKLTGRQAALDRPFETVKKQIESRLSSRARSTAFNNFVDELKAKTNVQVNEEALAAIEVEGAGVKPAMDRGGAANRGATVVPSPAGKADGN